MGIHVRIKDFKIKKNKKLKNKNKIKRKKEREKDWTQSVILSGRPCVRILGERSRQEVRCQTILFDSTWFFEVLAELEAGGSNSSLMRAEKLIIYQLPCTFSLTPD